MKRPRRDQRGFTVVEAMVAALLFMVSVAAMFAQYRYQMFSLINQNAQLDTQQAGRAVLDLFGREVRQAGTDPTHDPPTIPGIVSASTTSLQIQFDRNASGVIDNGEQVTYQLSDGKFTRTVNGGTATEFASGAGAASGSLFTYYDGNGLAIVPAGAGGTLTAAQRDSVRRVRISLRISQQNADPNNNTRPRSPYSTNVDLRNRWMR